MDHPLFISFQKSMMTSTEAFQSITLTVLLVTGKSPRVIITTSIAEQSCVPLRTFYITASVH